MPFLTAILCSPSGLLKTVCDLHCQHYVLLKLIHQAFDKTKHSLHKRFTLQMDPRVMQLSLCSYSKWHKGQSDSQSAH